MIQSMTGYASKTLTITTAHASRVSLVISIKSFNSRFFETTCKVPTALSFCEMDLIKKVKAALFRGHIYITMHIDSHSLSKKSVQPALSVVEGYIDAIGVIKEQFHMTDPVSLHDILRLPNVFTIEEVALDTDAIALFWIEIDSLIARIVQTRQEEGAFLYADMCKRFDVMDTEIAAIATLSDRSVEQQKIKIQHMIAESEPLQDEGGLTEARKNALYLALDKMDIHEEIIRFKGHLAALRSYFTSDAVEKGKRIDFVLQELGREANTITAKCADATIIGHAINVKVEIEKIREQAQNIV